LPMRQAG